MNYNLSPVLFLSCILASGCGTDSNKKIQEEGDQVETDSASQSSVNKEILEQLTKLREETSDLRNKMAELQTQPVAPRVRSQSVGVVSETPPPQKTEPVNFPINKAAAIGSLSRVKELVEGGADINSLTQGSTPLHRAVSNGRDEIVKYLIENGADVNKKDSDGHYPADLAQMYSRDELFGLLKDAGGKSEAPPALSEDEGGDYEVEPAAVEPEPDVEMVAFKAISEGAANELVEVIAQGFDINARFDLSTISDDRYPEGLLPVAAAIHSGNPENLQFLLKNGAKLVHEPSKGDMPLIRCLAEIFNHNQGGDSKKEIKFREIFSQLLAASPGLADKKDKHSAPLFYAANYADEQLIEQLLQAGADPNISDEDGLTPLHLALMATDHSDEPGGEQHGHQEEIAMLLVQHGANVKATGKKGESVLTLACRGAHANLVKLLIDERGMDPNAKDSIGISPLLAALMAPNHSHNHGEEGHSHQSETAMFLVESGADVDSTGPNGENPMKIAIRLEYFDLAKILIEKSKAVEQGALGAELLALAAVGGEMSLARMLVQDEGVDINSVDEDGQTPLHTAAKSGQADLCKYLIDSGAGVNTKSKDGPYVGDSPLDFAYAGNQDGKGATLKVLKAAGAKSGRY
jgi:ankyrin repeat protein